VVRGFGLLSVFAVFMLLMAGCPQQPVDEGQPEAPLAGGTALPAVDEGSPGATGPGITERPDYLNETMFEKLPPFPSDLYRLRNQIKYGEFWDMASIGEEYYKQPEFYPTFESVGLSLLQKRSGMSPWGFGAYPGDVQVLTFPNDNITLATFFFSSWGVETYQGIGLDYKITDENGAEVDYLEVDVEPSAVVMGPNYPVFAYEWAQKVVVEIHVKEDTPIGTYTVGVDATQVPAEKGREWSALYGGLYTEGGGFSTGMGRPYFKVMLTVT